MVFSPFTGGRGVIFPPPRLCPAKTAGRLFFCLLFPASQCYNIGEKQNMRQISGLRPPEILRRCHNHLHNGPRPSLSAVHARLAYMNAETLALTIAEGRTVFWRRSRQEIWRKGATSGHVQKVKQILVDCDQDALIVLVDQCGAGACHTGHHSCYYRSVPFGDELIAQPQGEPVTLREADGGVGFDAEAVYGKGH